MSFGGPRSEVFSSQGGPNAVILEGDHNGDGVADIQIFFKLNTTMVAGDFIGKLLEIWLSIGVQN